MKEISLPNSGGTARIVILDGTDTSEVLNLQESSRAALPEDKKLFIPHFGTAYFQNLLTGVTGKMVGVRVDGKLVAQMAVIGPMELREAIAMRLITNNDIPFHHASLTDSVVIFANKTTHGDWRGQGLGAAMVSFALTLPLTQVADHVFAQISVGDRRSWDVFARMGFGIVAAVTDPQDQEPRFIFQKPAFGFDFAPAVIADEVDAVEDFAAIINLTKREALVGIYDGADATTLSFMRNRDASTLLPTMAKIKTIA